MPSICSGLAAAPNPLALAYGGSLWRDQLAAYVNERIGRPTVLVGNSLGGYAALAAGASPGRWGRGGGIAERGRALQR